jgi:uncharacterized protein (TIGR02145 family)
MQKKQNFSIFPLLIMGVFLVFVASSCSKDDGIDPSNGTNGKTTAVFSTGVTYGTMTDQDGNTYKTITIGTQTWMAENLRTTKYNDGTAIPNVTDGVEWESLSTGAYCNYENTTSTVTKATYGRLYNWYAVNTGKLAPKGWHVPSDAEWTQLTDYLGGEIAAGGKLKEAGTAHWHWGSPSATNETGFTALPGGLRDDYGTFYNFRSSGFWWSSTEFTAAGALYRYVHDFSSNVYNYSGYKEWGFSVRCVRD